MGTHVYTFEFYRDGRNRPHLRSSPACTELEQFVESDIQADPVSCKELIDVIDQVQRGSVNAWEGTGNAYTVSLTGEGAVLHHEWSPIPPCEVPLEDFRGALLAWLSGIQG